MPRTRARASCVAASDDAEVHPDLAYSRERLRSKPTDGAHTRRRNAEPDDTAGDRERDALEHESGRDAGARGAERAPKRELAVPLEPSHDEEVRRIRAGEHEQQERGTQEDQHRALPDADRGITQAVDAAA